MADTTNTSDPSVDALMASAFPTDGSQSSSSSGSSGTNYISGVQAINQIESSGASDTASVPNGASSAQGSMQVLKGTRTNPGFGVTPSNGTPQDNARVGRDYYKALVNNYTDPTTAALAYNWGPGNVDNWIKNGADPSAIPKPQQSYLAKYSKLTGISATPSPVAGSGSSVDSLMASAFPSSNTPQQAPANTPAPSTPAQPMSAGDDIANAYKTGWNQLTGLLGNSNIAHDIGQTVGNTVNNAVTGTANFLSHPGQSISDAFHSVVNGVGNNLSQAVQSPGSYAKGAASAAINPLASGLSGQALAAASQAPNGPNVDTNTINAMAAPVSVKDDGSQAFKAGKSAGNLALNTAAAMAAPEALGAEGLIAKSVIGNSVANAANSAENGGSVGDVIGSGITGAAGGLAGGVVGKVASAGLGSAINAGKSLVGAETNAAKQAVADSVAANGFSKEDLNIGSQLANRIDETASRTGQTSTDVANQLEANAQNAVPGYQPTAAEATTNPTIHSVQRGLEAQNMEGLEARAAQNVDAEGTHAENQAATPDQISILQDQAGDAPQQQVNSKWQAIAGTPEQTAAIEQQRTLETSPMYQDAFANADPIPVDGQLEKILNTPAGKMAFNNAEKFNANSLNEAPLIDDNKMISPQNLNQIKMEYDNILSRMANPADTEVNALKSHKIAIINQRNMLNNILSDNVPGFAQANKLYQTHTDAMNASKFLNDARITDAFGNVDLAKLDALNEAIRAGQANNNPLDKAKLVSQAKTNQLIQMQKELTALKNARGTVATDPFGQLAVNSAKNPQAFNAYMDHLQSAGQSSTADAMQSLAQHQNYESNVMNKMDGNRINPKSYKNIAQQSGLYTPEQEQALQAFNQNRINREAYQYKNSRGSVTANKQMDAAMVNELTGKTGVGKYLSHEEAERVARMAADAGLGVLHLHGPIGSAVAAGLGWAGDKTIGKVFGKYGATAAAAKTASAESLTLNPERLAQALKVGKQLNELTAKKAKVHTTSNGLLGGTIRAGLLGSTASSNDSNDLNNK